MCIRDRCDILMSRVMKILNVPIPVYSVKQQFTFGTKILSPDNWFAYIRPTSIPLEELRKDTANKEYVAAHRYIASVIFSVEQDQVTLSSLPFVLSPTQNTSNLCRRITDLLSSPSQSSSITLSVEIRFKVPCTTQSYTTRITFNTENNDPKEKSCAIEVIRLDYNHYG
eukprot:TRINITY_DN3226_c0_g1_i1.p1 TRINITY_DN3226_c0_g1~~TRINITY_DN3226_c0_g1_i1.p1  ORF type:complete len:169 (-),score=8.39 TRINITY_DN3226_c0_g1_i1:29-535(-)